MPIGWAPPTALAMQLDHDTNNTSLVLAFELGPKKEGGPVLLFAADAQVGNWLSWQNVTWTFDGRTITGPDLLKRTDPLQGRPPRQPQRHAEQARPRTHDFARAGARADRRRRWPSKVKWGTLPWTPLLDRLTEKTNGGMVRRRGLRQRAGRLRRVIETPLSTSVAMRATVD